jgi:DUF4097 and DUF4098 domain-containing protein YvlB
MMHLILAGALAVAMQQTDTTIPARPGGRIEIDNHSGSVTVRAWTRNEVRIQASHDSRTEVEIDRSGSTISIDASGSSGPGDVRYTINVPRSFRVSVDGIGTDIDVSGTEGDIDLSTVDGDITVGNITGRVQAESVSGFIAISGVRGRVSASGTNEGLRLSNITGDLEVESVNGSISMMSIQSSSVTAETVNGDIVLGSSVNDGGSYSLSTTNGNIWMGVPEGTNATIDVSTYSGRLETSLPIRTDRRRSGEYSFRIGSGSASIEIESFSGNVRLVRPAELRDVAVKATKTKHK